MNTLYKNIKELCEQKGITPSKMCTELGISRSAVSNLKNGIVSSLSTANTLKIADYFDVNVSDLLNGAAIDMSNDIIPIIVEPKKTSEEDKVLELLRSMNFQGRYMALSLLETLSKDERYKNEDTNT